MYSLNQSTMNRQRGVATLAIGMMLLLLITLVVLYSSRSTILEQRIAANDYQAKMVQAAATAGLNHAIEHINGSARVFNTRESYTYTGGATIAGWLDPNMDDNVGDSLWGQPQTIAAGDCDGDYTPDLAGYKERIVCESGLHGDVFYYDSDGTAPTSVAEAMDAFTGDAVNLNDDRQGSEFRTAYNVDYVLCPLNIDPAATPPNPKVQNPPCKKEPGKQLEDYRWYAIVVASEGFMVDENGARIANSARTEAHEVVVKFDVFGAGPSVPLMVSGTFGGSGTFDIVANPNGGAAPATGGKSGAPFSVWSGANYDLSGGTDTCQLYEFYTTGTPHPHSLDDEYTLCFDCECPSSDPEMLLSDDGSKGIDILDGDPNFPDDVFQYIFGVPREDRSIIQDIARANGQYVTDCTSISEASTGLWWVEGDCSVPNGGKLGRPSSPLVVVVQGRVTMNADAKFYGVLYAFQSPELKLLGGAQVYGAVIGDNVTNASGQGNHSIVYDQAILDRVMLSPDLVKISRLPGTWSDRTMTR